MMRQDRFLQRGPGRVAGAIATVIAAVLAACGTPPPPRPAPVPEARPPVSPPSAATPVPGRPQASGATNPRDYRKDAAGHVYSLNRERVYPGRLPPMLYAVGVLQVDLDGQGQVRRLNWMRAPRHAPEVIAEIERTVRAAAPYPAPARMGSVTWTDTWLWDRSGRFQLDTLTEGQD